LKETIGKKFKNKCWSLEFTSRFYEKL